MEDFTSSFIIVGKIYFRLLNLGLVVKFGEVDCYALEEWMQCNLPFYKRHLREGYYRIGHGRLRFLMIIFFSIPLSSF